MNVNKYWCPEAVLGSGPTMSAFTVCPGSGRCNEALWGAFCIWPIEHLCKCKGGMPVLRLEGSPNSYDNLAISFILCSDTWFSFNFQVCAMSIAFLCRAGISGKWWEYLAICVICSVFLPLGFSVGARAGCVVNTSSAALSLFVGIGFGVWPAFLVLSYFLTLVCFTRLAAHARDVWYLYSFRSIT